MAGISWLSRSRCNIKKFINRLATQQKFRNSLTVSCKTWTTIALSQQLCMLDLIVDFLVNILRSLLLATKLSQRQLVLREWSVLPHEGHGPQNWIFCSFFGGQSPHLCLSCLSLQLFLLLLLFGLFFHIVSALLIRWPHTLSWESETFQIVDEISNYWYIYGQSYCDVCEGIKWRQYSHLIRKIWYPLSSWLR